MSTNISNLFESKFDNNEVISFDLFDTLVEEPFSHHSDLFDLMSHDIERIIGQQNFEFKKIRLLAEIFAVKNSKKEIIDLNDIYYEFQKITSLNQNLIMEIEKLEICFEQKFYQVRPIGKQLFNFAQSLNKKIIIISENYLPRFFIEGLLDRLGYCNYNELFVSSEIGLSKKTGNLFPYLSEKLFCDSKYILHIGDDEIEDLLNPQKFGFNTLPILSSYDCYKNSFYYKNIWQTDEKHHLLSTRLINGLLASKFFQTIDNQSLNSEKSAFNQDSHRIGYFGLGPVLLGYTQWLLQKSQEDYVKHLYFLSSNSQLLKKSYDMLSKYYSLAPSSSELLSSDRICQTTNMIKEHVLYEILNQDFNNITIFDYFKNNFHFDTSSYLDVLEKYGLNNNSIVSYKDNEKQIFSFFEEIKPYIKEIFNNEKNYYSVYLKYQNLPNPDKSAIVDLGYNENNQSTLSEIAKQKIGGYYLLTFLDTIEKIKKNGMPISGYLGNFEEKEQQINYETLFHSIDNDFITFELNENTINPIFSTEDLNNIHKTFVNEIQDSALEFIADFEQTYHKNITQLYFSPKQVIKPLFYFLTYKDESAKILKNINLEKQVNISESIDIVLDKPIKEVKSNDGLIKAWGKVLLGIKKAL